MNTNCMPFKDRLQLYGTSFSKSEMRIADFINNHLTEVVSMPSSELSSAIGTSTSTLTRFCKKLHYRNYIEFQTLLSNDIAPQLHVDDMYSSILSNYQECIRSTLSLLDTSVLEDMSTIITRANRILIFGIGSSALSAKEFCLRLAHMGIISSAITDSTLIMTQGSLFSSNDLIIAISNSGETKEVINACKAAKQAGAQIYAFTQSSQSSLAKLADKYLLVSDIHQLNDERFMNVQIPILYLIDCITYLLFRNPEYIANHKRKLSLLTNP